MLATSALDQAFSSLTSFLLSFGYTTRGFQKSDDLWETIFENTSINRSLKVCLFKQQSMFLISIGNNSKGFHLLDYCEYKGLTTEMMTLKTISKKNKPLSTLDLENLSSSIIDILANHLIGVIVGKNWEEIPFNFGYYK